MNLEEFYFLLSDEGKSLLTETAVTGITPQNHLPIATTLRNKVTPSLTQAIIETVLLRQQATAKFSRAHEMFFLRPALEQATSEIVSTYRTQRFAQAGIKHIADLGCGIGGDALALAAQVEVTGVEWQPVRLAMAQENVRIYGYGQRFHPLQADLMSLTPLPVEAVFFDPARRNEEGKRIFSVHDYQPPLSLVDRWRTWIPETAVKISPGVHYSELPKDAEVEFIAVKGEVKEAVLWFGELRTKAQRRATLLPHGYTLTDADNTTDTVPILPPQRYLYEPNKAIIRAHLVKVLAQKLGAAQIDSNIAYLTGDIQHNTPFARCFTIEAHFPFQLKKLRRYLQERRVGKVTIKKRGSPIEIDYLRSKLRLKGDQSKILFLTHISGEPSVIISQI